MQSVTNLTEEQLQTELKKIPDEYQTIFQETLEREIRDGGHDDTDADRLAYLRRRQDDMQKGAYIRPDGKSALITATNPDDLYGGGGVDGLTADGEEADREAVRQQTILKIGGIAAVVLTLVLFISLSGRSRAQAQTADMLETTTPVMVVAAAADSSVAETATPELPALADAGSSLETIGSLGAALQVGRPGAIELHFRQTEEVVALAVDPARVSPQGGLPFHEEAMTSDQPLAVWVHGSVLNYAMGIPDALAQNLQDGDRIILSTDTGHSLPFVVTETFAGNVYDSARYLSQNRVGMTLFSLPALAEDGVRFVLANYDMTAEDEQSFAPTALGEPFSLTQDIRLEAADVTTRHNPDGLVVIQVSGKITQSLKSLDHIVLSLSSATEQTQSANLNHQHGRWSAEFQVTDSFLGADIFAQFRAIPAGKLQTVYLSFLPALAEQLQVSLGQAYWQPETRQAVLTMQVANPGPAAVRLDPSFFTLKGGDAQHSEIYFQPTLPILLDSQAELSLEISFLAQDEQALILTGGDDRWEITVIPTANPE
ncbi:MAG: hypothetical protein GY792_25740 [Gammaproteobacteria bacterium]|nr:hypothetical protein [Gammaproteobacteria bacterium]